MKNTFKILLISTGIITVSLLTPASALAWDDCPKGKENDPYPGDCARYIDTDGNGICDHSEPAPEDRVESADKTSKENVETTNGGGIDSTENIQTKTNPTEKDNSFSKALIAVGIVIINLAGIILYAKHKNSKVKTS